MNSISMVGDVRYRDNVCVDDHRGLKEGFASAGGSRCDLERIKEEITKIRNSHTVNTRARTEPYVGNFDMGGSGGANGCKGRRATRALLLTTVKRYLFEGKSVYELISL